MCSMTKIIKHCYFPFITCDIVHGSLPGDESYPAAARMPQPLCYDLANSPEHERPHRRSRTQIQVGLIRCARTPCGHGQRAFEVLFKRGGLWVYGSLNI